VCFVCRHTGGGAGEGDRVRGWSETDARCKPSLPLPLQPLAVLTVSLRHTNVTPRTLTITPARRASRSGRSSSTDAGSCLSTTSLRGVRVGGQGGTKAHIQRTDVRT
jgi:hypothetical protein